MEARWPPKGILERGGKRSPAPSSPAAGNLRLFPAAPEPRVAFQTDLGQFVVGDCLGVLRRLEAESVDLVVTSTERGFAGDTATGARKPATMETGLVVQVPLFVNEGDLLRIDTRTGEYQTRIQ